MVVGRVENGLSGGGHHRSMGTRLHFFLKYISLIRPCCQFVFNDLMLVSISTYALCQTFQIIFTGSPGQD